MADEPLLEVIAAVRVPEGDSQWQSVFHQLCL